MVTLDLFDRYLEPVAAALTPQSARALVEAKPDEAATARVAELGLKSNAGTLTDEERDEYRLLIDAGDLIAILKAKARRLIADHPAS